VHFDTVDGNVRFKNIKHRWQNGKCVFCGASESEYGRDKRGDDLETHAYEIIHTTHPEEIFNMKFDVIIGNPPYQLSDGGNGVSASPIYQRFIEQAIKLKPRYLSMIVPSRYFAGGKGLDAFREKMLADRHIIKMVDFINAKDCFPQNSISGGVNYFLWDRDHEGDCEFTTVLGDKRDTQMRKLNEFSTFVRYNSAVEIIHKVQGKDFKPL
jgi:site-specific DNA-methyltransferase (adenine-specific)